MTETDELLKETRQILRAIMEGATEAIFITGKEGRNILANAAGARLIGRPVEEIIGKELEELFPAETAEKLRRENQEIIRSGKPRVFEEEMTVEGKRSLFRTTRSPFRDEAGEVVGIIAIGRDVTSEKVAEENLRNEHELRKSIENSIPAGIAVADHAGKIIYVNPALCKMVGWSQEEMIGNPVPHLFWPPEESDNIRKAFQNHLEHPESGPAELILRRKNEERFPALVWPSRLNNGLGKPIGLLGAFYDMSETKKMEREVLKVQKLESLGIFAGGVAHDFNNIMTSVLGNISLAKSWLNPEDRAFGRLSEAENASLRARDLATQLLTFAKGGAPVKTSLSIQHVLENSVKYCLTGTHVKSQIFLMEDLWQVDADEGQISQVIQNLLINAKRAMPEGGTLWIKAENFRQQSESSNGRSLRKGAYVMISIRDEGEVMPGEAREKENGLGLSAIRSIIEKHQGYIVPESQPGRGTTFNVFLPASLGGEKPHRETTERLMKGSGRILVVDDERSILNVADEMLRHMGYEVEMASSGSQAIQRIQRAKDNNRRIDAVITDLTIPGDFGGIALLQKLKEIDPELKVIVSSGYSTDPVMSDYRKYGFSNVIMKPYRVFELSKILHDVVMEK